MCNAYLMNILRTFRSLYQGGKRSTPDHIIADQDEKAIFRESSASGIELPSCFSKERKKHASCLWGVPMKNRNSY